MSKGPRATGWLIVAHSHICRRLSLACSKNPSRLNFHALQALQRSSFRLGLARSGPWMARRAAYAQLLACSGRRDQRTAHLYAALLDCRWADHCMRRLSRATQVSRLDHSSFSSTSTVGGNHADCFKASSEALSATPRLIARPVDARPQSEQQLRSLAFEAVRHCTLFSRSHGAPRAS